MYDEQISSLPAHTNPTSPRSLFDAAINLSSSDTNLPTRSKSSFEPHHERPTFHPRCVSEAVDRVITVKDLLATGELQQEVARMGIMPQWLNQFHATAPYVAISEQLLPLTTLFGKLGKFGKPEALRNAILHAADIASELSQYSNKPVKTGIMSSPDHAASGSGITSGFYLLLPNLNFLDATDKKSRLDSKLNKLRLITNRQLGKQDGLGYRDLTLRIETLEEIGSFLVKEGINAQRRLGASIKKHEKQEAFNARSANLNAESENGPQPRPVDREMYVRERSLYRTVKRDETLVSSLLELAQIWQKCLDTCSASTPGAESIRYWDFVTEFNNHITRKICPNIPFGQVSPEYIDNLATTGVGDWKKFLGAFFENKLIETGEPILRYRNSNGKQETLALEDFNSLTVRTQKTDKSYRLEQLVDESRQALEAGEAPRLIPIAVMRYWAMFAAGNGIALEDGMPYHLYQRLYAATLEGDLMIRPRGLLVSSYTELNHYKPKNVQHPYSDIREEFHALQYLKSAQKG